MAVLDFKRSTNTPSTLAKGTLQFVDVGGRFKMLIGDNSNNPREANYLPFQGGMLTGALTSYTTLASPLILLRDGGDVGINMNGRYLGNSNGVLRFGTNTTHANNNEVFHSGNLTKLSQLQNDLGNYGTFALQSTSVIAGTGLTGGGTLAANRTLTVNFGTAANTVAMGNHTHTFASLTNKPTTLGGYGITDGYTRTQQDSRYLKLAGGTLTGALTAPTIEATAALIIPQVAPVSPEANKTYLYIL